jgi:DNA-directed RNA polymerase subunit alpha
MYRNWTSLIRPESPETLDEGLTHAQFAIYPLERGYGQTLATALRRALLSSIRGAAIVGVRMGGVDREFSSVRGVREDVTEIVQNLKQVLVRYEGEDPVHTSICVQGPRTVTAGDLIAQSAPFEVLNPSLVLCTLNTDAQLDLEVVVKGGRGFVAAERHRDDPMPHDMIPVDALFAPVRRVAFNVSHVRVGQMTDYDKLTLDVWTNGVVTPRDALALTAKILKEQLQPFVNFDEQSPQANAPVEEAPPSADKALTDERLARPIATLELSVRSANCLESAGINTIGDLVRMKESDLLKTKNFGRKSLNEIREILAEMNLTLGMSIEGGAPARGED